MDFIFCKRKKAQKHGLTFCKLKKFKNMNSHFLQAGTFFERALLFLNNFYLQGTSSTFLEYWSIFYKLKKAQKAWL